MSGTQALAWVVNLLIKYVTCFNFFKSINQSIIHDVSDGDKIESRLLFYWEAEVVNISNERGYLTHVSTDC